MTTTQMWQATTVALLLDVVLAGVLWRLLPRHAPEGLRWPFAAAAAALWTLIYGLASVLAWDSCYQFVLPSWVRWAAWLYGLGHGVLGYAFWWIARHVRLHPVAVLVMLGGLHSFPGHLIGIYSRGLLEACPIVRGVTPAAALTFGGSRAEARRAAS